MASRKLSEKLSEILRDLEIGKWEFASSTSDLKKTLIASKLVSLEYKAHLLCKFNQASGAGLNYHSNAIEDKRLASYISQQNATSTSMILKRLLATKNCMDDWEKAKKTNDFSLVEDSLQRLVDIKRVEAKKRAKLCNLSSAYDAILDQQTPGLTQKVFDRWDKDLSNFCKNSLALVSQNFLQNQTISLNLSRENQEVLVKSLLTQMDLDLGKVKFDESAHPMCLGGHDNVVMGFVYDDVKLIDLIQTISHEGGHALYRQNLPDNKKHQLTGRISGAGIDEAMALIFENHVCKNKDYLFQTCRFIKNRFGEPFKSQLDHHQMHAEMIKPSNETIRILSDQIRYPLDVILRYRLEKALFDEELPVKELPNRWRSEFKALTGMDVKDDCNGVLQDIHWFGGEFGWFPNYLFGQLAAAQLFEKACKELPSIEPALQNGDIRPLKQWLDQNIYSQGAQLDPLDLIDFASGKPLGTDAYKSHIKTLYKINKKPNPGLNKFIP